MDWMYVDFSPREIVAGRQSQLQDEFVEIWIRSGAPPNAIMYGGKSVRDNRCYFTPAAVALARNLILSFGAVSCPEPDLRELVVLVKNEGAQVMDGQIRRMG